MTFETVIKDLIELLGGDDTLFHLEKDYEFNIELESGLMVKIAPTDTDELEQIIMNAELGDIPQEPQLLMALLMANKTQQQEENAAVFSIDPASSKVNCAITISTEACKAEMMLEQLKRLVAYQEWFNLFESEDKPTSFAPFDVTLSNLV